MPGLNGIETIRKLRVINPSIIVFILTNYTNYMTDVFRVGTFQFLKKPLRVDDLKYDLLRAVELYKHEHYKIKIKENDNIRLIDISKIRYLEVYQKELKFRLLKEEIIIRGKISDAVRGGGIFPLFLFCLALFLLLIRYIICKTFYDKNTRPRL